MSEKKKRAKITVKGDVQGVGFRHFAQKQAHKTGLFGYVKNLASGSEVTSEVEGDEEKIKEFISAMKQGPHSARVEDYEVEWSDVRDEFSGFSVRY